MKLPATLLAAVGCAALAAGCQDSLAGGRAAIPEVAPPAPVAQTAIPEIGPQSGKTPVKVERKPTVIPEVHTVKPTPIVQSHVEPLLPTDWECLGCGMG